MKVKIKVKEILTHNRLPTFEITPSNRHQFTRINTLEGPVYLRKNRLSTVIYVDTYGNILNITGENPNKNKIGENIYK